MVAAYQHEFKPAHAGWPEALPSGTRLLHEQYVIERFLNVGSFGMTYVARDSLERRVVLKECFPRGLCRRDDDGQVHSAASIEFKTIVQLFMQEARALATLDHPNIVGVHQVFEDNRTAYMALDFVDGHDLTQVMDRMFLPPDVTQSILRAVLDAIGFVHEQGLLHRDVSPDNILIDAQDQPVLIDFGAARQQAKTATRGLAALRVVKDGYSPLEFYNPGHGQGPWSDLYGLAATFYHLITGSAPPSAEMRQWAFESGHPDPYTPLSGTVDSYPPAFLAAIDRGLAMHPQDRFQTAEEWMDAIAPPEAAHVTPVGLALRLRQPKSLAVIALSLTALTGAAFVWGLMTAPTTQPALPPVASPQVDLPRVDLPKAAVPQVTAETAPPAAPTANATTQTEVQTGVQATPQTGTQAVAPATSVSPDIAPDPSEPPLVAPIQMPTPEATLADTPAATLADTPAATLADTPAATLADTPAATLADTPAPQPVAPAPLAAPLGPLSSTVSPFARDMAALEGTVTPLDDAPSQEVAPPADTVTPTETGTPLAVTRPSDPPPPSSPIAAPTDPDPDGGLRLANGIEILVARDGEGWATQIAAIPTGLDTDLQPGDVILAHVASNAWLSEETSLSQMLDLDRASGVSVTRFAVAREGRMAVAYLSLSQGTAPQTQP